MRGLAPMPARAASTIRPRGPARRLIGARSARTVRLALNGTVGLGGQRGRDRSHLACRACAPDGDGRAQGCHGQGVVSKFYRSRGRVPRYNGAHRVPPRGSRAGSDAFQIRGLLRFFPAGQGIGWDLKTARTGRRPLRVGNAGRPAAPCQASTVRKFYSPDGLSGEIDYLAYVIQ